VGGGWKKASVKKKNRLARFATEGPGYLQTRKKEKLRTREGLKTKQGAAKGA